MVDKKMTKNRKKSLCDINESCLMIVDIQEKLSAVMPEKVINRLKTNANILLTAANKLNIPVIALADSNVNPENVDIVIPGNDDAIRSIELIASSIADACLKGAGKRKEVSDKKEEK